MDGSTSGHPARGRPEPRALPPRQEVHVHHHWHGVTAEDVAAIIAIIARVNHGDRGRVD